MSKALSIKERIRRSGPATKKVTVWLGADVTLIDEYDDVREQLAKLDKQGSPTDSLEDSPDRHKLRERLTELRARLDEYALEFRVRALDGDEWQRLVDAHPPRRKTDTEEADLRDAQSGWNTTTFPRALMRAATVEPDLDNEDWTLLLGNDKTRPKMTDPQIVEVADTVARLSRYPISVPFS